MLGGEIVVLGYPLPMVIAEKLVTAVARGTANTRWRDFYDLWHLSRRYPIRGDELRAALVRVGEFRGVGLRPFTRALVGYAELGQGRWQAWCRRQRLEDHAPRQFAAVLDEVGTFADPALEGGVNGRTWEPEAGRWH